MDTLLRDRVVMAIANDNMLSRTSRRTTAALVQRCGLARDELLVDLSGPPFVIEQLRDAVRFEAVQAAVKSCVARNDDEYDQVELVLSEGV